MSHTIDIKLSFFKSFNKISICLPCTHPRRSCLSLLVIYHDIMRRNRKRAVYLRFAHVRRENIDVTFASPSILAHLQRCDDVNEVYAKKSASMSSMRSRYAEDSVVVIVDFPQKSAVDSFLASSCEFRPNLLAVASNSNETRLTDYVRERFAYQKTKRWHSE